MRILGLETSCDETGVAILDVGADGAATVVGEVLSSQIDLHRKYGGVVPELASREHMRNLPLLCQELFDSTGLALADIEGVGVTCGPGLKGCLLIGVTFAQGLVAGRGIPLFPVNHIEGHILSGELHTDGLKPPYLALVVSGGHTEIVLVEGLGRYSILCRTRDDAAGEAFDKSANLLGLSYPGGAALAALAEQGEKNSLYTLPRVAREMEDFSFSGLKTAVSLLIQRNQDAITNDPKVAADVAWVIQNAIVDALVTKTVKEVASRRLPLVVCGGVSANRELKRRLQDTCREVHIPPLSHCVDNGAMIAYVAGRYLARGIKPPTIDIFSRWPVNELARVYGVEDEKA
jgi:N6-L-threonylcarbamoyladenine synthase